MSNLEKQWSQFKKAIITGQLKPNATFAYADKLLEERKEKGY